LLHDVEYDAQKAPRLAVKLHHFTHVKFTHWRHYLSELAVVQMLEIGARKRSGA
jgi:hypothetical protein